MYDELVTRLRELADEQMFDFERRPYLQAADAIEEMSREIDINNAAMTAMDAAMPLWIPVEERLPEDEKDVLVCYGFVHDGVMSERRFIGVLKYFAFDAVPHWQHESTGLTVTHWMRILELPKEEASDGDSKKHL